MLACCLQGSYSMFIALLPHLDPMMFYLATQQNAQTQAVAGAEKTAFAWYGSFARSSTKRPKLWLPTKLMATNHISN